MDKTRGKILIDGNSAAALGSMFAGVHRGDLVSDHPFVLALRNAHRVYEALPS